MNIHPLFVHFPIGLLATYSVVELLALLSRRVRTSAWIVPVNTFLLSVGVLAALAAIATGGIAEDLIGENPIVEVHEPFAFATTAIYFVLAAAYLIRLSARDGWGERIAAANGVFTRVWIVKKQVAHLVLDTWLRQLLALAGLIAITITGGLGAAIVYGPNIDPFVSVIYHLFFP